MSVSVYYELSSNCWTNCATTWLLFCWIWESSRFSNLRCFKGPEPQMFGPYGYGSIPINTIFRGMNIHKSQLFWCELQGYKVLTHCHIWIVLNGAFNLAFCIPCVSVCMLKWRPLSKMDDISSCKKYKRTNAPVLTRDIPEHRCALLFLLLSLWPSCILLVGDWKSKRWHDF